MIPVICMSIKCIQKIQGNLCHYYVKLQPRNLKYKAKALLNIENVILEQQNVPEGTSDKI